MRIRFAALLSFIAGSLLVTPAAAKAGELPSVQSAKEPVTNHYDSTSVVDDYQWLETPADTRVRDWMRLENERTRAYFGMLPYRQAIAEKLTKIYGDASASFGGLTQRKGMIFALRFKPPAQQPVLVRLSSLDSQDWKPVFDPNAYNTNGTTAIDWYVPSPDGKLVAISLSEGGSEQGVLHFFETDTGKELSDRIPRVQFPTAGGSAA